MDRFNWSSAEPRVHQETTVPGARQTPAFFMTTSDGIGVNEGRWNKGRRPALNQQVFSIPGDTKQAPTDFGFNYVSAALKLFGLQFVNFENKNKHFCYCCN